MFTTILAAVALLATTITAIPNPVQPEDVPTTTPSATATTINTDSDALWVTVDSDGKPSTVTPIRTTISGTPTLLSGAPNKLTATVQTHTIHGQVTTSTGAAPLATATAAGGAGSFEICTNESGPLAPWCIPTDGMPLYPGSTYYFTWDASYFSSSNTTLRVQGNYFNSSTGLTTTQAFQSDNILVSWGFWTYTIDKSLMQQTSGVNISLQLAALRIGGQKAEILKGPTVLVTNPPVYQQAPANAPVGLALYIGLPAVLVFVVVCIVGTFLWNRQQRRIGLGNIMSRSRHGYSVGRSARSRMRLGKDRKKNGSDRKAAEERIQLMEQEVAAERGGVYRDIPESEYEPEGGRPRRDSDALGSLAGTPTEDRRMEFQRPGGRDDGRNLFRDEMKRQDGERL
ncbi:uncharacterized protein BCR38DRAFT_421515 [Pseudomassariella vexata]|uniref:Uncharacterized protein n=1 Tax=Pseudomassariella vexata TaxID=1141098 RepID=A0A1Y2EFQ5_9PEZI|nr:uncharacterized protein BCR38DRAFT_421515 [Pseudomassariella vexata]ORY70247.1 hypothetical protein BCR38DRAFT_421515 [Pseudomassariella vexata]